MLTALLLLSLSFAQDATPKPEPTLDQVVEQAEEAIDTAADIGEKLDALIEERLEAEERVEESQLADTGIVGPMLDEDPAELEDVDES